MKLPQTSIIFARNKIISHRFPSFLIAFAQICPLLLPEFPIAGPEFREKAMGNSDKTNGKFGQKQWENLGKSNEKTWKAAAYISGKNYCFCPISHCFFPKFPLLLPEFFVFILGGGGHSAPLPPPPPPPPPTPMLETIDSFSF